MVEVNITYNVTYRVYFHRNIANPSFHKCHLQLKWMITQSVNNKYSLVLVHKLLPL